MLEILVALFLFCAVPGVRATTVNSTTICPLINVTDHYRVVALSMHLQYRDLVFAGQAPNKQGLVPSAQNYYKIAYDCDLEASAFKVAQTCELQRSSTTNGELFTITFSGGLAEVEIFANAFTSIADSVLEYGILTNATANSKLANWNQAVHGHTNRVGCSTVLCSSTSAVTVCHYNQNANAANQVYVPGDGCLTDSDCSSYGNSTCDRFGMCLAD